MLARTRTNVALAIELSYSLDVQLSWWRLVRSDRVITAVDAVHCLERGLRLVFISAD